jgi:transcriptional regulator with XRE-family HTH domain
VQAESSKKNPGFAERLAALMMHRAVSQAQLAGAIQVTQPAISNYLHGRVPAIDVLARVADYFKISVPYLLSGEQEERVGFREYFDSASKGFPGRLKTVRERLGLSRIEFGERIGFTDAGYIERLERGQVQPTRDFFDAARKTFGLSPHWLELGMERPFEQGTIAVAPDLVPALIQLNREADEQRRLEFISAQAEWLNEMTLSRLVTHFLSKAGHGDESAELNRKIGKVLSSVLAARLANPPKPGRSLTMDDFFHMLAVYEGRPPEITEAAKKKPKRRSGRKGDHV